MRVVTGTHLRTHGYTFAQYQRVYLSALRAGSAETSDAAPSVAPAALDIITDELLADTGFVRRLADEVGGALFNGSVRSRLRVALVSVIHTRLTQHGAAVALLEEARKELAQPWRINQGGPNGGPTDTKDLIGMVHAALAEVKTGEDLLLRAVKTAIDESKAEHRDPTVQSDLDRFTGEAERIPVPKSLTAGERETVRNLIGMLERSVQVTRHIEGSAEVGPARPADEAEPAGACSDIEWIPTGHSPATQSPPVPAPEMTNTQESASIDPILDF